MGDYTIAEAKARLSIAAVRARNSGQEKVSVIADDVAVLLAAHSDLDRATSAPAGDGPARIDRGASEALGEMVWTAAPAGDDLKGQLWCLHVLGPDDVHPAPDRATAQLWAAQWTVYWHGRHPDPRLHDPVMSWVVAPWPHDPASHAAALAKSIADNTWPVDPLAAPASAPAGDGVEDTAWAWMEGKWDVPADRDYSADEIVDAFIAGRAAALARPRAAVVDDDIGLAEAARDLLNAHKRLGAPVAFRVDLWACLEANLNRLAPSPPAKAEAE